MAKDKTPTSLSDLGEFGLIETLTKDIKLKNSPSLVGVGDDAAVIDCGDTCRVVTTDMLTEGIHFDLLYTPMKHKIIIPESSSSLKTFLTLRHQNLQKLLL